LICTLHKTFPAIFHWA